MDIKERSRRLTKEKENSRNQMKKSVCEKCKNKENILQSKRGMKKNEMKERGRSEREKARNRKE